MFNVYYDAPHSRVQQQRPTHPVERSVSRSTTTHDRKVKVSVPPLQRYAGFFNERRSSAPRFPTAQRFSSTPDLRGDVTPGPAAYNTARSSVLLSRSQGVSIPRTGRDAVLPRRGKPTEAEIPGPGAYNCYASAVDARGVAFTRASRGPPVSAELDASSTPGPGAYNPPTSCLNAALARRPSSTVRSRPTSRSASLHRITNNHVGYHVDPLGLAPAAPLKDRQETIPGPGAYHAETAIKIIQKRAPAIAFPTASRFGPSARRPRSSQHREVEAYDTPGPGSYTPLWGLVR